MIWSRGPCTGIARANQRKHPSPRGRSPRVVDPALSTRARDPHQFGLQKLLMATIEVGQHRRRPQWSTRASIDTDRAIGGTLLGQPHIDASRRDPRPAPILEPLAGVGEKAPP